MEPEKVLEEIAEDLFVESVNDFSNGRDNFYYKKLGVVRAIYLYLEKSYMLGLCNSLIRRGLNKLPSQKIKDLLSYGETEVDILLTIHPSEEDFMREMLAEHFRKY